GATFEVVLAGRSGTAVEATPAGDVTVPDAGSSEGAAPASSVAAEVPLAAASLPTAAAPTGTPALGSVPPVAVAPAARRRPHHRDVGAAVLVGLALAAGGALLSRWVGPEGAAAVRPAAGADPVVAALARRRRRTAPA